MSDHDDCIHAPASPEAPQTDDDGNRLFRHTFIWRLRDPKDRAALLQLAEGFDNCLCELGCWGEDGSRMLPSMGAALADDVEALAAYALTVARVGEESQVEPRDAGIVHFAAQWAERLAMLATEMRIVVAAARGAA